MSDDTRWGLTELGRQYLAKLTADRPLSRGVLLEYFAARAARKARIAPYSATEQPKCRL
jgi:hypothetical protein